MAAHSSYPSVRAVYSNPSSDHHQGVSSPALRRSTKQFTYPGSRTASLEKLDLSRRGLLLSRSVIAVPPSSPSPSDARRTASGHVDRTFSPTPSTNHASPAKKSAFAAFFKRRKSQTHLDRPQMPTSRSDMSLATLPCAKPRSGTIDTLSGAPPAPARIKPKRSLASFSGFFKPKRTDTTPFSEVSGGRDAHSRSPLPRDFTKSPSLGMLYEAAHQDVDEMLRKSTYTPIPGSRQSMVLPTAPALSKTRSSPDLYLQARQGSTLASLSGARQHHPPLPANAQTRSRAASPLPALAIRATPRSRSSSMDLSHLTRAKSPTMQPASSDDIERRTRAAGALEARTDPRSHRRTSTLAYLESEPPLSASTQDSLPSPRSAPSTSVSFAPTVPEAPRQLVAGPARLFAKTSNMRPSTAGTFGRPNTGNRPTTGDTERPDTATSVRARKPSQLQLGGRLKRIIDYEEDEEDDEAAAATPHTVQSIPSVDVEDCSAQEMDTKAAAQEDSGYVGDTTVNTSLADSNHLRDVSKASSPSGVDFPCGIVDGATLHDLKKSLNSSPRDRSGGSVLSQVQDLKENRLSRWRDDCLEALSSTDGGSDDIPPLPSKDIAQEENLRPSTSFDELRKEGKLYESILKTSFGMPARLSEDKEQTPRAGKKGAMSTAFLKASSSSSVVSALVNRDWSDSLFRDSTSARQSRLPLPGAALSLDDSLVGPPLSPAFDLTVASPVASDDGSKQARVGHTPALDPYANSYFPPYDTLMAQVDGEADQQRPGPLLSPVFGELHKQQELSSNPDGSTNSNNMIDELMTRLEEETMAREALECEHARQQAASKKILDQATRRIVQLEAENRQLIEQLSRISGI